MFALDDVSLHLGDRTVLHGITLSLTERRIGVVGPNGSGKSSLARLLNGLLLPSSGSVTFVDAVRGGAGRRLDTRHDGGAIRRRVGFVFTDPDAQIVMPTVAEDVAFSLRRLRLGRAETRARVDATLTRMGLSGHRDHPAHLLSGGQKQMLALASVLVTEPSVLVCDEPTTLLDLRNARMVSSLLEGLDQQVIVVTHDLDALAGFDRVLVVDEGRVVADGVPSVALDAYRRVAFG